MTLFIGDVHGRFRQYKRIISKCRNSIQVGDMGLGFRNPYTDAWCENPPYDVMRSGGHLFIRGNHDNPNVCRNHSQWIRDGTVEGDVMFIGGATSIDKAHRIDGYSWWPDEELSRDEMDRLIGVYEQKKPRAMVTHECPEWLPGAMGCELIKLGQASNTRAAFATIWELHRPELWIFGHWHLSFDKVLNGTASSA
jgi:hypothetical protein